MSDYRCLLIDLQIRNDDSILTTPIQRLNFRFKIWFKSTETKAQLQAQISLASRVLITLLEH